MAITRSNITPNTHEALTPTAYDLSEVILTLHTGDTYDITTMVDQITVTESIYRMSLICSIRLYDANNFFEDKEISGQEKIDITWHRSQPESFDEDIIEKTFYVADIPVFSRVQDHSQVYQFDCISKHAFLNNLKLISRSFSGTHASIIEDILKNDLEYEDEVAHVSEQSIGLIRVVVPNWRPFNTIQWVLRNATDQKGGSFFCYETLTDGIKIMSYSEITDAENYREYHHGTFFEERPDGEDYEERQNRILEIQSDLYMSKFNNVREGAYGSTTLSIDISTKQYRKHRFNYEEEFSQMYHADHLNVNPNISRGFRIGERSLGEYNEAKLNFISNNSLSFDARYNNYHAGRETNVGRHQSFENNMDNFVHDVKVTGDYNLQPGLMVGIHMPKAVDPETRQNDPTDEDLYVSGNYMVTSVVHNFGKEYICDMRVKKDTMSIELSGETNNG
jgi:hypothetical protein